MVSEYEKPDFSEISEKPVEPFTPFIDTLSGLTPLITGFPF